MFVSNALEAEGQAMQFDERGWVLHEVLSWSRLVAFRDFGASAILRTRNLLCTFTLEFAVLRHLILRHAIDVGQKSASEVPTG